MDIAKMQIAMDLRASICKQTTNQLTNKKAKIHYCGLTQIGIIRLHDQHTTTIPNSAKFIDVRVIT